MLKHIETTTKTEVIDFNKVDSQMGNTELLLHLCLFISEKAGSAIHRLYAIWANTKIATSKSFPEWLADKAAIFENYRDSAIEIHPRWTLSNEVLLALFAEKGEKIVEINPNMQIATRQLLGELKGISTLRRIAGKRIDEAKSVKNFLAACEPEEKKIKAA